jgi:hypothetical protein
MARIKTTASTSPDVLLSLRNETTPGRAGDIKKNPTAYNHTVTNQRVILLMAEYRLAPGKSPYRTSGLGTFPSIAKSLGISSEPEIHG